MLGGFELPTDGEIFRSMASPWGGVPPYRRPTNMVFQSYAIFPHLNVFDNIAYGLRKAGLSAKELNRRVDEALAMIKLSRLRQTARRPIVRRPAPTRGAWRARWLSGRRCCCSTNPWARSTRSCARKCRSSCANCKRRLGITFVFVTHDQEEALSMSDRIAVMSEGKVVEEGNHLPSSDALDVHGPGRRLHRHDELLRNRPVLAQEGDKIIHRSTSASGHVRVDARSRPTVSLWQPGTLALCPEDCGLSRSARPFVTVRSRPEGSTSSPILGDRTWRTSPSRIAAESSSPWSTGKMAPRRRIPRGRRKSC